MVFFILVCIIQEIKKGKKNCYPGLLFGKDGGEKTKEGFIMWVKGGYNVRDNMDNPLTPILFYFFLEILPLLEKFEKLVIKPNQKWHERVELNLNYCVWMLKNSTWRRL